MNCRTAVVEFLKSERGWIHRETLIQSLESLGKHSGGVWPRTTRDAWEGAIQELLDCNEIVDSPNGLRWRDVFFAEPAVGVKKSAKRSTKPKPESNQGTLF